MMYGCPVKVRVHPVRANEALFRTRSKEVKPDIRNTDARPPAPINDDLNELLVQLADVTDPFLVFL